MSETRVVGRVRKAFGLKGELLVHPITNEPDAVFASGRVVFCPAEMRVERARPFKDAWLVKLAGIDDKSAADAMRGTHLSVLAAQLPAPDENEVYLEELEGMHVRDAAHGEIGAVENWYEVPQGLVLEVRGPKWRADIPFNAAFVTLVNRDTRTIEVHLPDGLVEPTRV